MPLVNAKCTNCGATIEVDDSKEAAICKYCGSAFIVEKAINNYGIINNISNSVINIYNGEKDFEINAGKLIRYNGSSTKVTIPESVKTIDEKAFFELESLESVSIPESVVSIGAYAFNGCSSLTSVTIPNSVTKIEEYTFYSCSSLTSVILPDSITEIDDSAFSNCKSLISVTIPDSVTKIGKRAFAECSSLTRITIPNSVKTINSSAFSNCESLLSVTIPNSIKSIGYGVFEGCSSLTSVIIPDSVTDIGERAFKGCRSLTSVTIQNGHAFIYKYAFSGCSSLTSVVFSTPTKYVYKNGEMIDKSESSSSSGCYVATCVYGSYDCPEVWTLRRYRDNGLARTWYGRAFIHTYYAISPTLVKWFGDTEWFKKMWRGTLDKMVNSLQDKGYESTPYNDINW